MSERGCSMALDKEKFAAARRASGLTIEKITQAAGVKSINTYLAHEDRPGQFRLEELAGMYKSMSDIARPILREAICDIFLPE